MNIRSASFFTLLCLLIGCSKQGFLKEDYLLNDALPISGHVVGIDIKDARANVTYRELKLPILSFPGETDEIYPLLTGQQEQVIRDQINKYLLPGNDSILILVDVKQGTQQFSATFWSEREYV